MYFDTNGICIKFCVKNEIKCNKVCEMLTTAYDESAMSKTRVYEWYKRFQDGCEDVEDDERPSTSTTHENVENVKEMVMNDRRITIREVADLVGILIGSCHEIFLNVLGMKRVADNIVPKLLNFEQKKRRMEVAQENEVNVDAELLKRIITGEETWVYGYDDETTLPSEIVRTVLVITIKNHC